MTMTLDHPRYPEFLDRLSGPDGINLREDGSHDCEHSNGKPLTREVLHAMGFNSAEITSSLAYFEARGGFCDHEVVLDVEGTDVDHAAIEED